MRLGYLYSRYPVISQTFCDAEMLALERRGIELVIGSIYPPLTSLRHEHIAGLRAPIHYAPPQEILKIWEKNAKTNGTVKGQRKLVAQHEQKYGPGVKAEQRARNALYFADFFSAQWRGSCSRPFRESCSAHRAFPQGNFRDSIQRHGARTGFHERPRQRRSAPRNLRCRGIRCGRNGLQPRPASSALSGFGGENSPRLQRNGPRTFSECRLDEPASPKHRASSASDGWLHSRDLRT